MACEAMGNHLSFFINEISKLKLNQDQTNTIFKLAENFSGHAKVFNSRLMADGNGMNCFEILNTTTASICNKLSEHRTRYKRQKNLEENESYVKPREMAVGLRWDLVRDHQKLTSNLRLVQCKFQYISIIDTLTSLFKRKDFNEAFNIQKEPSAPGVYSGFSSGNVFKCNELFSLFPKSIQIQIGTDDFEVCNELGSKSTLHKICAFYFTIRNVPLKYRSKLNNIFILLLCNSDDLKTQYTDMNDVLRPIVRELQFLEDKGIQINPDVRLRGTLTNMSHDNLGGNTCLGLVEGFRTLSSCCKICECDRAETKRLCIEDESQIRDKVKYQRQLENISVSEKIDYLKTQGVKRYCVLNDLKYYNTWENSSVDIMHDLNEGCIPFLLKNLFTFLIKSKIISEENLLKKFQYYDYGFLNRGQTPSVINLNKKSLNQNSSQTKCLFFHVPFVLYSVLQQKSLRDIWKCFESLFIITLISYSLEIHENDLHCLEKNIEIHLRSIQETFRVELLPKHHFLTHYARVIRQMGSLVPMSMLRYESKHKELKRIAKNGNNFKNVTKTIASMHQQQIATCDNSYVDDRSSGIKIPVSIDFIQYHQSVISSYFQTKNITLNEIKWMKYFEYDYRVGFFIFDRKSLFEINKILSFENDYLFFLIEYDVISFERMLNSINVKPKIPSKYRILDFKDLDHKQVYERKLLNGECFIIIDSLETKRCIDF